MTNIILAAESILRPYTRPLLLFGVKLKCVELPVAPKRRRLSNVPSDFERRGKWRPAVGKRRIRRNSLCSHQRRETHATLITSSANFNKKISRKNGGKKMKKTANESSINL